MFYFRQIESKHIHLSKINGLAPPMGLYYHLMGCQENGLYDTDIVNTSWIFTQNQVYYMDRELKWSLQDNE